MGKLGVLEGREGQAESRVHVGLSRQADGGAGVAVVGHPARDDLRPLRLPDRIPVVPGELDGGVVRLRARALEDHARHGHGRNLEQRLGERNGRLVRAVAIEMVVAELAHLLVGDLGEPLGAEAERSAPQPRDRLDVVAAGIVEHATALAAHDDLRAFLLVPAQVGLHVHQACDVARLDRVRNIGHSQSSDCGGFAQRWWIRDAVIALRRRDAHVAIEKVATDGRPIALSHRTKATRAGRDHFDDGARRRAECAFARQMTRRTVRRRELDGGRRSGFAAEQPEGR